MKLIKILCVLSVIFFCGCVHKENYNKYLSDTFVVSSSKNLIKGWGARDLNLNANYKDSLVFCENLLVQQKPKFTLKFKAHNIFLECMNKQGFDYSVKEVLIMDSTN